MGDKEPSEVRLSNLNAEVSGLMEEYLEVRSATSISKEAMRSVGRKRDDEEIKRLLKMRKKRDIWIRGVHLFEKAFDCRFGVKSKDLSLSLGNEEEESSKGILSLRNEILSLRKEEESSKGPTQIMVPLCKEGPGLEGKLYNLVEGLSRLEEQLSVLEEAEIKYHDHHQWASLSPYEKLQLLYRGGVACPPQSLKEMDLLRKRMELLCYEAESYKLSAQSQREHFLVSLILTRFKSLLKERASMIQDHHVKLSKIKNELSQSSHYDGGMIWKLISFPQQPSEFRMEPEFMEELENLLESTVERNFDDIDEDVASVEEYPDDIEEEEEEVVVASELDVAYLSSYLSSSDGELVRNNGDRVSLNQNTLRGKHVLVCCFNVPFIFPWVSYDFYTLINLCNELYLTRGDDFEMIMVARMNSLANEKEVFDHFFSGFPKPCLAVPFEDKERRDTICKAVGLSHHCSCRELVFLNPERELCKQPCYEYLCYGAEAFPFTAQVLDRKHEECREIIFDKVGLEKVLRCTESSPRHVYKFNPSGGREEVAISELEGRHVLICLCVLGDKIRLLREMYDKCRGGPREFEVVVVSIPFETNTEPGIHERMIDSLLQEHNDWWGLPFDHSVTKRFMRLTDCYDIRVLGYGANDKLMMVGPEVGHLDMYGSHVMARQGIDAFPFTVEAGIALAKKQLQVVRLESLFRDGVLFSRGNDGSDSIKLTQLLNARRKKIMLCIVRLTLLDRYCDWPKEFETLEPVYLDFRMRNSDFELVFVEDFDSEESVGDARREEIVRDMPWYVCPRHETNAENVRKLRTYFRSRSASPLVGFGEGRICCYKEMQDWDDWFQDTLDCDIEYQLGYWEYNDYRMKRFARPRRC